MLCFKKTKMGSFSHSILLEGPKRGKLRKDSSSIFPPPSPSTHIILLMNEHNGERRPLSAQRGNIFTLKKYELKVEHSASQGTVLWLQLAQSTL